MGYALRLRCEISLAIALGLLATSCAQPAMRAEDRLVDGNALPSIDALSRERIEINQGFGGEGFGEHFLSFELAPDNSLIATYTFRPDGKIIAREAFSLSPDVAKRVREQLWRIRPEKLEGVETDVRPLGCRRDLVHDFPDFAVGFAASDKNWGIFSLPRVSSCQNRAARAARRVLDDVLRLLPKSRVADSFAKARAANQ